MRSCEFSDLSFLSMSWRDIADSIPSRSMRKSLNLKARSLNSRLLPMSTHRALPGCGHSSDLGMAAISSSDYSEIATDIASSLGRIILREIEPFANMF